MAIKQSFPLYKFQINYKFNDNNIYQSIIITINYILITRKRNIYLNNLERNNVITAIYLEKQK